MAIVLRKGTHPHDAVQAAGRLVAVTLSELTKPQRQIAVALDALLEDDDVTRAVHRLERIVALFRLGHKHVLAVLVPVPSLLPQALVQDLRALDLLVAVVAVHAAHVLLHLLPHGPALGVPEHGTGRVLVDVEQVQLTAELAVVALLGFFQHREVLLQLILARPSRAIHALQHFVAVVTAPVRARHLHQLEELQLASARNVWAAAKVFKLPFTVQTHVFIAGNAGNDFSLVVFTQALEISHSFIARQHPAHHRLVLRRQLSHLLLDGCQIFRCKGALVRKVVIKPVFDHWPDGDLRIRKQLLDGISQQVGCGVANDFQTIRILGCDDRQRAVCSDLVTGINHLVTDLAGQCGLGQTCTNRRSDFGHGDRAWKFALRAIRKRNVNHGMSVRKEADAPASAESSKQKSAEPAALFGGSASRAGANGQPLVAGEDLRRSSRCHNQGAFLALVGGNCRHFNHPRGTDSKKPGQARALSRYLPAQISGTALLR